MASSVLGAVGSLRRLYSAAMGPDESSEKSLDAGRMGKAAELLVAATCILQSRAKLNVSTSIIDDEGVDLVFHCANTPPLWPSKSKRECRMAQ